MRSAHRLWIGAFFLFYAATFLPNFGILNTLTWVGPLPLPLAWVLLLNVVNTAIVIVVYKKFFKPYAERMEREMSRTPDARGDGMDVE